MHSKLLSKNIHKDLKAKKARSIVNDKKYIKKSVYFYVCVLVVVILAFTAYGLNQIADYSLNLPSTHLPFDRKLPESSIIYDNKGNILYTIYKSENRIYLPFDKIPNNVKMATLAAEDINFYTEDGINPLAIGRSLAHDVFSNTSDTGLQGASTITQQLVKYTTLAQSRTVERKVKEIILTLKISQLYSKNQILEAYLNAIPYGGSNYGIESASRAYFGIDAGQLDLAQASFLAGLPQAPGIYSPLYSSNPNALVYAKQRQSYVLDQMLKYKAITGVTKEQVSNAKNEILTFKQDQGIKYPSFVLYVRQQLFNIYGEDTVDTAGLRVYTTLDSQIQDIADKSVENGVKTIVAEGLNSHNASLVALDSTNGNLLAMVGSANYQDQTKQVDGSVNMTLFPISPGSSVKPFVYITAFEHGMDPNTILQDTKTTFTQDSTTSYTPMDFDNKFEGDIPLSRALLESRNIPAVEAGQKAGINNVYNNMLKAGMDDLTKCQYGLSLSIGACDIPLLQHTSAYQVLSQDGVKHPIRSILTIDDKYGKQIYENTKVQSTKTFDEKYVREINDILKNYHTLTPVKAKGYTVAGKTGTGQDNKNNLFMGYSSHLTVGVWSGNTDQSGTSNNTFGEDTAAPIWDDFMLQVLPMFSEDGNF